MICADTKTDVDLRCVIKYFQTEKMIHHRDAKMEQQFNKRHSAEGRLYQNGRKTYMCFTSEKGKVAISRDVKFVDALTVTRDNSGDCGTVEVLRGGNYRDCDGTESVRDIAADNQRVENTEQMRRSARRNKGGPPIRFIAEIDVVVNREPSNYDEAVASQNKHLWIAGG